MKKFRLLASLILAALACGNAAAQLPVLIVKNAWVRQTPGSEVAAVYLNLRNTSAKPVIVIGVRSPLATHAMIHRTSLVGGQSQMRMKERIVIAPGQTVVLSPGGTHIMLSGVKHGVTIGQTVPIVLLIADGGPLQVAAIVRPLGGQ